MNSAIARLRNKAGRGALGAVGAALLLALSVLVVQSSPRNETTFRLGDGSAWLSSNVIGGISLLDGSSGSIAASLGIAQPGDAVKVVEWGSDALVVNETTGTIGRLAGADWTIATGLVRFGEANSDLDLVVGDSTGWVIKSGSAAPVDLSNLEQRQPIAVGSAFVDGLVATDGSLLLAGTDAATPARRLFVDGETQDLAGLDGPVAFRDLGGQVAAVDLDDQRVWLEGEGIVCDRLELPSGAELQVGGADGLLLVVADSGGVMVWNPVESGCPDSDSFLTIDAGRFGKPAVTEGWAVVPDLGRGEVVVLDLVELETVAHQRLEGVAAGAPIQVRAENGTVWFNDPGSDKAGLVRQDGNVIPVAKYDSGSDSGFVAAPIEDPGDEGQEIAVAGVLQQQEQSAPESSTSEAPEVEPDQVDQPDSKDSEVEDSEVEDTDVGDTDVGDTDVGDTDTSDTTSGGNSDADEGSKDSGGPTTEGPSTTVPGDTDSGETDPVIEVRIGSTASQAKVGEVVTFQAIPVSGNPAHFDFSTSPKTVDAQPIDRFGVISYTFAAPGEYLVSVQACDAENYCDSATVSITITSGAVERKAIIANPGTATVDRSVVLRHANQGSNITGMQWNFGPGATPATSTEQNPSVTWDSSGSKTVELTIFGPSSCDGNSCSSDTVTLDSTTRTVTVVAQVAPYDINIGGPDTVQVGEKATYVATTADPAGLPNPHWNVAGAGIVSRRDTAVDATWQVAGTYEIAVSTETPTGNGSGSRTITVIDPPADAPNPQLSGPSSVDVNSSGTWTVSNSGGALTSYSWTTTGGSPSVAADGTSATKAWALAGSYTVTVTATGPGGSASDSMQVVVNDNTPQPDPLVLGCNQSSVPSGNWVQCPMQGDPSLFTDYSFSITWPDPGQANSWGKNAHEMHIGYLGTGTVTISLSATHIATGLPVTSNLVSIVYTEIPAPTTVPPTTPPPTTPPPTVAPPTTPPPTVAPPTTPPPTVPPTTPPPTVAPPTTPPPTTPPPTTA